MRFGASRSQLYDAQKTARVKWDGTLDVWNDQARQDFQEKVWEPMDQYVSDVLRSVDQLTALFSQVRAECEFGGE
jgi:hypothetical protein